MSLVFHFFSAATFFVSGVICLLLATIANPAVVILRSAGLVDSSVDLNSDMRGMVTIVTGSNTGIGLETARRIAENGATVVLACRSLERGEAAKRDIEAHLAQCSSSSSPSSGKSPFADSGKVLVRKLDLADLDSVKSFADSFLEEFPRLDVLVNNAGLPNIFLPPDRSLTKQGLEMVYGTNFIGHFLLTKLLVGRLMAGDGGRVVNLASVCHQFASKGDGILEQAEGKGPQIAGYNDSKLAMILHARELMRRHGGGKLLAVAVNPGFVASDIWRQVVEIPVVGPVFDILWKGTCSLFALDTKQGALPSIYAASQDLNGSSYLSPYWVPQPRAVTNILGRGWWLPFEMVGIFVGVAPLEPNLPAGEEVVSKELWRRTEGALAELGYA